jgi:hypothetical protein
MNTKEEIIIHLRNLEESLQDPSTRKSVEELNSMIAEDFIEFGSSGKVYNKQQVISTLLEEHSKEISTSGFKVNILSSEVALITYTAERCKGEKDSSLRSSVWKNTAGTWRLIFHQGTPMSNLKNNK